MYIKYFGLLTFLFVPIFSAVDINSKEALLVRPKNVSEKSVSKCCANKMVFIGNRTCVALPKVINLIEDSDLPVYDVETEVKTVKFKNEFRMLTGIGCTNSFYHRNVEAFPIYMQQVSTYQN